jgi:hypothetical protein
MNGKMEYPLHSLLVSESKTSSPIISTIIRGGGNSQNFSALKVVAMA